MFLRYLFLFVGGVGEFAVGSALLRAEAFNKRLPMVLLTYAAIFLWFYTIQIALDTNFWGIGLHATGCVIGNLIGVHVTRKWNMKEENHKEFGNKQ